MQSEYGEIIIYEAEENAVEVRFDRDTVWLTQRQMAELFDTSSDNISLHLKNIFADEELEKKATTEDFSAVQKEGERQVRRMLTHYNLDAIISVGYRVNSKRGVRFRQWATSVLKEHLIKGYTVNERRLAEKGLSEMAQAIALLTRTLERHESLSDEGRAVLEVINRYARSWSLLLRYDEDRLELPKNCHPPRQSLDYGRTGKSIKALKDDLLARGEASGLFGREREHQLQGILGNLDQTFGGRELYASVEEKAAHLLYFVIKDHPFSDGNKRIGAFLFLLFLKENNLLEQSGINDNGLVALALLIAESDPRQKELMIRLIMNMLAGDTK
ncbi:MAG: virulence protein RhuM/Fic/DOC family protein [Desulfocapsaceae bacterium]|nr:virulence protein RhuM/Fic/DOC family protein [Desulfocapsaceae bacterium]